MRIIGEKLGRKKTFLIGVTIMSIGAILQSCSYSRAQIIVARLITGAYIPFECLSSSSDHRTTIQASEMGKHISSCKYCLYVC